MFRLIKGFLIRKRSKDMNAVYTVVIKFLVIKKES